MPQSEQQAKAIDDELQRWSQGDIAPASALQFVHVADLTCPLTPQAEKLATDDLEAGDPLAIVGTTVETGFVVLSQTCDVVRFCADRPFVEIAVLQPVSAETMGNVKRGRIPRLAFVPAVEAQNQVADLDRTMTIEKTVLAQIPADQRVPGCRDDAERQAFASALSRKYNRFAFPDDFNKAAGEIINRIRKGHGRDSDRGRALLALREIRIECAPNWTAPDELTFLFLFDRDADIPNDAKTIIEQLMDDWVDKAPFIDPSFQIFGLDSVTAARYLASQPLDFDYLSQSTAS